MAGHVGVEGSLFSRVYKRYMAQFRIRRMRVFDDLFSSAARVVDVGGAAWYWEFSRKPRFVVLLNIDAKALSQEGVPYERHVFAKVCGDALALPFGDLEFDAAFSNSVIEHLGTWERQEVFAAEIRRIAKAYFVQTPWKYFFLEPHTLAPGAQFVPRRLAPWVSLWLTPRGWIERDRAWAEDMKNVRLLTAREMRTLFPDARILVERVMGWGKSLIAVRMP
jgi:hypothetical protein